MEQVKTTAKQQGQAMTEFAVVAAFVLVPLFLLIPLLGKYIDIKHKTIQAARYEAWEYTAWNSDRTSGRFKGFTKTIPVKTFRDTKRESINRFYSDPSATLETTDKQAWQSARLNPLWFDHKGDALVDSITENNPVAEHATPDKLVVVAGLLNVVGTVADVIADVLEFIGIKAGFTQIDGDGNFQSGTRVKMASVDWVDPDNDLAVDSFVNGLSFRHEAAIMSEGWSAGGRDHTKYQVRGLVPTSLLDIPAVNTIRDIVKYILLSPELDSDWLKFGYVNDDAVPYDRLIAQGSTTPGTILCGSRLKYYRYKSPNEPTAGSYTGVWNPDTAIEEVGYRDNLPKKKPPLKKFGSCAGKL